jgi:hypothetical protein
VFGNDLLDLDMCQNLAISSRAVHVPLVVRKGLQINGDFSLERLWVGCRDSGFLESWVRLPLSMSVNLEFHSKSVCDGGCDGTVVGPRLTE